MKDKGGMELDTIMDAVVDVIVDVIVDAVMEEHTLVVDMDVDAGVASNAEGLNTATRMETAPIPAQSVKLPAQSTKLQQYLQTLWEVARPILPDKEGTMDSKK